MSNSRERVKSIFRSLAGPRAEILEERFPAEIRDRISAALERVPIGSNINDPIDLSEIGFHLVDWNTDAAFIVALHLFPEEFTDEEICDGIERFLVHAPAHCIEAARLGGYSTENPFLELE